MIKQIIYSIFLFLTPICILQSCQNEIPLVNLGIDDVYLLPRMKAYKLSPGLSGKEYRWSIETVTGKDSLVSTDHDYIFLAKDPGIYNMRFEIIDDQTPFEHQFRFVVVEEEVEYSPYISKVYEYRPAPGQFINTMPEYQPGDTEETMRKKAEECISGKNDVMISLGGYGGYIVFGFDHTVINVPDQKDILILGNAFYSELFPDEKGGSCEPGIVWVAFDRNQNGKPDEDEWYELAGSEYYKPETLKNYEITYSRPDDSKIPVPDKDQSLSDVTYIPWIDNRGGSGYVSKNYSHTQNYYPQWIKEDRMVFTGTKLANNAVDKAGDGSYYMLYAYDWGYVDNHPNNLTDLNSFDIDWAVDTQGNKVHLPGVDFIKVCTAINQYCGRIGEISTEIIRAQDLHIKINDPVIPYP
ncbi:cell surface protein [Coprobacter tertius]|uniref:Cell surface protein n=1 Tax=Coprobacter tertius TaxID=2944915 RepID=A0ABT1MIM4_9BACT|nr:cell surface protein [Coprobacter tertius]MCP9612475.1 cell surface protein [Coprobacter tertius]